MITKNNPPTADELNKLMAELRYKMNDPTNIEKFVEEGRLIWLQDNYDRILKGMVSNENRCNFGYSS